MPIPPNMQRRIAHIDVLLDMAFQRSVTYWNFPSETECRWLTVENQVHPMLIGQHDALVIEGDSGALLSAPDGGVLHINGDLNFDLESGAFHEIVIHGNVSSNAIIRTGGYSSIYIGGSMRGRVEVTGSSKIWIDGNFTGSLLTGDPSTHLYIAGDLEGIIASRDDPSLLFLCVDGFASQKLISAIASIGYVIFNASVGISDVDEGIYPVGAGRRLTALGNSYSRWCVLSRRDGAE